MHFCLLVSATFVLLMAASVAESGRGKVKKDGPTGGSRNAQRQQGGSKKNSQTESKTENAGTSQVGKTGLKNLNALIK
uniref:Secreted protein n=1 Tax=Globodera pallida TaxID=36090 RepID=A0A183BWU2_GLOPA